MLKYFTAIDNFWAFLAGIATLLFYIYKTNHSHTLNQRSDKKRQYTAKESNKVLYFFFAVILIAILLFFYTDYKKSQNIISENTKYLLDERFNDNSNHWDMRTTPQGKATITGGNLQMYSTSNMIREKTVAGMVQNSDKVSIKTEFNGKMFSENGYFGFCWGLSETDGLFIIFRGNGCKIGEIDNHKWIFFNKDWLSSNLVSSRSPVVLEIVKKKHSTEIYLDGILLTSLKGMDFQGDEIGFVTNSAEIVVDFVQVAEIE